MAGWEKKIRKSVSGDLIADEELRGGVFVQPFGMTGNMMATEIGGMIGKALARSKGDADEPIVGHASTLPDERLVLGLTDHRLVVWGHSSGPVIPGPSSTAPSPSTRISRARAAAPPIDVSRATTSSGGSNWSSSRSSNPRRRAWETTDALSPSVISPRGKLSRIWRISRGSCSTSTSASTSPGSTCSACAR